MAGRSVSNFDWEMDPANQSEHHRRIARQQQHEQSHHNEPEQQRQQHQIDILLPEASISSSNNFGSDETVDSVQGQALIMVDEDEDEDEDEDISHRQLLPFGTERNRSTIFYAVKPRREHSHGDASVIDRPQHGRLQIDTFGANKMVGSQNRTLNSSRSCLRKAEQDTLSNIHDARQSDMPTALDSRYSTPTRCHPTLPVSQTSRNTNQTSNRSELYYFTYETEDTAPSSPVPHFVFVHSGGIARVTVRSTDEVHLGQRYNHTRRLIVQACFFALVAILILAIITVVSGIVRTKELSEAELNSSDPQESTKTQGTYPPSNTELITEHPAVMPPDVFGMFPIEESPDDAVFPHPNTHTHQPSLIHPKPTDYTFEQYPVNSMQPEIVGVPPKEPVHPVTSLQHTQEPSLINTGPEEMINSHPSMTPQPVFAIQPRAGILLQVTAPPTSPPRTRPPRSRPSMSPPYSLRSTGMPANAAFQPTVRPKSQSTAGKKKKIAGTIGHPTIKTAKKVSLPATKDTVPVKKEGIKTKRISTARHKDVVSSSAVLPSKPSSSVHKKIARDGSTTTATSSSDNIFENSATVPDKKLATHAGCKPTDILCLAP